MKSKIPLLKYVFLGLLLVGCTGITAFDLMYTKPKQRCAAAQGWWSPKDWKCYAPIYLPSLTGRKPGEPATLDWHDKTSTLSPVPAPSAKK